MTFSSKESRKGQISTVKTTKYVVETMRYATFVSKCEIGTQTRSVIKTRPPQDVDVLTVDNPFSRPEAATTTTKRTGTGALKVLEGENVDVLRSPDKNAIYLLSKLITSLIIFISSIIFLGNYWLHSL